MTDDRFLPAIQAIQEQIRDLELQVIEKKKAANVVAQIAGSEPLYSDVDQPAQTTTGVGAIRADQFANYSAPSAAARAYLEARGLKLGATTIDVIFDALQRGGFAFQLRDEAAKNGLSIALGKDSRIRYLKGNQSYGLWSWYPQAKRDKDRKSSTSSDGSVDAPEDDDANDAEAAVDE
jgi:hypothetical protein